MSKVAQLALLKLTQREKATVVLDKRTCGRSKILSNEGWQDLSDGLQVFYVEFYVQCKAYNRKEAKRNAPPLAETMVVYYDPQEESEDVDLEEPVQDANDMLPLRQPNHNATLLVIPEITNKEQRQAEDKVSGKLKYDNMIYDCYDLSINWREVYTKKELGIVDNEAIDPDDHVVKVDAEKMIDQIMDENERREGKFGCLPNICKNSLCQLGAVSAQSYAERMNSAANLLVANNRTLLDHDMIDKLVVLLMNRPFMMMTR